MRTLSLLISISGLVALWARPTCAQQVSALTTAERAGIALARLGARQRVRIRVEGVGLVEGSVEQASPSAVVLRVGGSSRQVPAGAVDSLWVHGTHGRRGALIGGAIGGIGLGAVAAALVHGTCESASGCNDVDGFVIGFLMGGVAGVVTGGLFGGAFPTWQLRVP